MSIPSTSREPLRPPHFKIDALQSEEIFALYDKRDEEALSFTYRGEYVGYPWGIDFWKHIFCHNDPIEERGWLETSVNNLICFKLKNIIKWISMTDYPFYPL